MISCCRYKKDKDGYYRLLTVRYESMDMKEQIVPGLTPSCVSEAYCPSAAQSSNSSVACDLNEGVTADPSLPMSNLELLGNVAFAMSRTDGADECLGQSFVLSTNVGDIVMADNSGQIPGSSIVYIVPVGDGEAASSFGAMMQQTVEASAAAVGEDVGDTECEPSSLSGVTNTASLYLTPLHDSYDALCNVGPVQFNVCNADSGTDEYNHDIAGSCIVDESSASIIGTTDSGFDMALDSFSLSMLTNPASC